jgi:hypothetical protein
MIDVDKLPELAYDFGGDVCASCNPEIIKLKTRIIELVSAARAVVEEFDEEKKGRNYVKRDYFGDGFVVSFNDLQKLKKLIEEPTNGISV